MRIPGLLILLVLASLAAGAQLYKWTDSQGRVHYGDRPPEDAKKQELKIQVRSYDGPVEVTDWAAILRRKSPYAEGRSPAAPRGITMYSTQWCGHCKRARIYFEAKGVPYKDLDIEASAEAHREYKDLGGTGVPLILVDGKVMKGFSADRFEKLRATGR